MSHTIASVSQTAFLPTQTQPGISAVASETSFGFEQEDAFERTMPRAKVSSKADETSEQAARINPLYRLILMFRRVVSAIRSLLS